MSEGSSDGSAPRPKKKPKKPLLSSESDSDSDGSFEAVRKRKRLRVVSDDDSSESSGSSVQISSRRSRLPMLKDSDDGNSDSSGWATDHSNADTAKDTSVPAGSTKVALGFSSDSSEGNSDKCSICLMRFTNQEVGTPETCEHIFCLDCITEWSKNVNTCPVDRITFMTIIVRACAEGKVLRKVPVSVVERRPSEDLLVVEDPTMCEICRSSADEATMLLCDGCDLGFHMQCLSPPLQEVPIDQWFCSDCAGDSEHNYIYLSEVNNLLSDIEDMERVTGARPSALREPRNVRRSARAQGAADEPSTSSGHGSNHAGTESVPSASRGLTSSRNKSSGATVRRRKYKRRKKTKTVTVEYEIRDGSKFPIKTRVPTKSRTKKRKTKKRQPRTAARRSHVRASVRARLATLNTTSSSQAGNGGTAVGNLSIMRHRAAIPALSLFGNSSHLDYFSDDEQDVSGGGMAAVALRPTSRILNTYRQARRKMITIPSPTHASSAPDILSSIMESQSMLHSKSSIMSITVDGKVNIKLQKDLTDKKNSKAEPEKAKEKLDLSKVDDSTRKAPSYPGQSRGGGWGGGYRGNYNRDQRSNNFNRSGGNYDSNNYGNSSYRGNYQGRQGNSFPNANDWHDNSDGQPDFNPFDRRPNQYSDDAEPFPGRSNMAQRPNELMSHNADQRNNHNRFPNQGRSSLAPSWQPYANNPPLQIQEPPQPQVARHSFGGFEDPLDMRVSLISTPDNNLEEDPVDLYGDIDPPPMREELPPAYEPLPEPPVFRFDKPPDSEKSEDEKSDSGLIIDTEKYDPTEPTHDDSSGEDDKPFLGALSGISKNYSLGSQIPIEHSDFVASDTSSINVPPTVLDEAVQQVLKEHRNLIIPNKVMVPEIDKTDDESDGDCPNFTIYSATSVNIANNANVLIPSPSKKDEDVYSENEEDLVQEDDEIPLPEDSTPALNASAIVSIVGQVKELDVTSKSVDSPAKKTTAQMDYDEKVSKRCPITPNVRNPIKIKLNTTTLIKRHVLDLYEDEEEIEFENAVQPDTEKESEKDCSTVQDEQNCEITNNSSVSIDSEALSKEIEPESPSDETEKSSVRGESKSEKFAENAMEHDKNRQFADISQSPSMESDDGEDKLKDENEDANEQDDNEDMTDNENDDIGNDELSDDELDIKSQNSKKESEIEKNDDAHEKMTESISETEDERSYTPCLDENKSKDTSLETEKEIVGIEGLDTEMISEDEGNEIFSDTEENKVESEHADAQSVTSPQKELPSGDHEEGEIVEKSKELKVSSLNEDGKKKKRREKKIEKDSKDKSKSKGKRTDVTFKKLSKTSKERNYRDKDEKSKNKSRDRRKSDDKENKEKARKREKRKDLERYDVRSVVTEKRRKVKDAFGRDTSRPRSKSLSASHSPLQLRRSQSKGRRSLSKSRRSLSRGRRSLSRIRRSNSKARYTPSIARRSLSRPSLTRGRKSPLGARKSISPKHKRSVSARGLSPFPSRLRSFSPRLRRSLSRRRRRSSSPKQKTSISRKERRSASPRRRSVSPKRKRSRSLSRGRKRIRKSLSRTSRPRKSKSPRKKTRRSRSRHQSFTRIRSHSPKAKKSRRNKIRKSKSPRRKSPKHKKRKSRSITPELVLSPERTRQRIPPLWRGEKSPVYQAWSTDSRSINSRLLSPSWTPPRDLSPDPRHLRVILANNDKARKREKKKRQRDLEKFKSTKQSKEMGGPSKEVFTSGNNILVSVSFNKNDQNEIADPIGDEILGKKRKRKGEGKKDKKVKRRRKSMKVKETENKKPVAIIDLEKSPFRELTPSPKNVIVLSDSDHAEKEDNPLRPQIHSEVREQTTQEPVSVPREQPFMNTVGPKTPPEPSVKFSIQSKGTAQLRPVNPLHEEDADEGEIQENDNENRLMEGNHKGPNTPPEPPNSPPSSPDAYDPFEPTKSGSATPEPESTQNGDECADSQEKTTITLETAQKTNLSADDVVNQRPITPIEKVMALLQSTRNVSPTQINDDLNRDTRMESEDAPDQDKPTQSPDNVTLGVVTNKAVQPQSHYSAVSVAPALVTSAPIYLSTAIPRINAFTSAPSNLQITSNQRIVLPSPTKSSPLKAQPPKLFLTKPSPIKSTPIKPMPSKTIISKLPLPSVKPISGIRKQNKNGSRTDSAINDIIDLEMNMDSPYSPGSSDFGDLFEPPSENTNSKSYSKPTGKSELFDSIFGSKPKNRNKSSATKVPVKQIRKKGKTQVGVKVDEDNLKVLDDLPSSAVEMQVKSKFLKKLNRQERVVEEVKLVLKPHYNKKHVTKDEYKEILRRAVPKICHNKTGEINPTKIQALVEAYVRKYRKKRNKQANM